MNRRRVSAALATFAFMILMGAYCMTGSRDLPDTLTVTGAALTAAAGILSIGYQAGRGGWR